MKTLYDIMAGLRVCQDAEATAGSEHSPWEWAEMDPLATGGGGGGKVILLSVKSPLISLCVAFIMKEIKMLKFPFTIKQ